MTRPPHSSRHRSREVALQTLYALDARRVGRGREEAVEETSPSPDELGDSSDPADAFQAVAAHFEMPEGAKAFGLELVEQVWAHRDKIDERIAAHARNWRVERMPAVDRNVLRIAVQELIYTSTPAPVILDEAVELARKFGSENSPSFVNGVLAAVAREVREEGR